MSDEDFLSLFVRLSDVPEEPDLPCPKNAPPLTVLQIITLEPRIAEILIGVKHVRNLRKRYDEYYKLKNQLSRLVGWEAEQYELRTSRSYDVVMGLVRDRLNL